MVNVLLTNVCNNIGLPECRAFNVSESSYTGMNKQMFGFDVKTPYTFGMIVISILSAVRMVFHVNSLFASVGGNEMKIVYYCFILYNGLLGYLVCLGDDINILSYKAFTAIYMTLNTTFYFAILLSGITADRIYGIYKMSSFLFMSTITFSQFGIVLVFYILSFATNNDISVIVYYGINFFCVLVFIFIQIGKLKKKNADIWPYGLLGVIFVLSLITNSLLFVLGDVVAKFSDMTLDNIFLIVLFNLIFLTMIHKYWINTCDFEVECLTLEVE
ncbi:CHS7 [Hepatospora eriocheir]|uniref:CHS7 n=1 Tax=Hepatospora eriocheir TaxID=1081669 RepID=A0A1X0QCL2_9MICR|nr:CHS7 [Hepatospora eriocheir]